jgi:hypothetical protein
MKIFRLIRISQIAEGTFGVLLNDDNIPFALTLERIWADNEVGKSCIPWGNYICARVQSPKFGNTFQVLDVPGRSEILFHKGNLSEDSHGCILVGEQFEPIEGRNGIIASNKGFEEFLYKTKNLDNFILKVISI